MRYMLTIIAANILSLSLIVLTAYMLHIEHEKWYVPLICALLFAATVKIKED